MTKWFEEVANDASNIVSSRVRLSRNWEEYKFPSRLEPDEARTMIARLKQNFRDLGDRDGQFYEYEDLELMEKLDRTALRERRLLNRTLAEKTTPGGILCSEDERVSMVLNADDHIRLQVLASGLDLQECYAKADALDDYINEKIPYAFNEKYGYLTSYPTNVGTAMKASVVVHLPSLTMNKKFQELLGDMGRFGTTVRGVYGRGNENYGDLYEVVNQKTLGITEQEILELVVNVAGQLSAQENQFREVSLSRHRLEREDEAYKSYGVLKYARRMTLKGKFRISQSDIAAFGTFINNLSKNFKPFIRYTTCITVNPFPGQFIECQLRLPTFKCRFSYTLYIFYHTGVKVSAELCCIKPINGIIFLP